MHGIGRSRRNQAHVHDGAGRPRVPLVDRVAVRIDLQRAVKVRALLDRTFAVVLDLAAPEDGLALVVDALELQPGVVGIDRAAREEVSDLRVRTTTSTRTSRPAAPRPARDPAAPLSARPPTPPPARDFASASSPTANVVANSGSARAPLGARSSRRAPEMREDVHASDAGLQEILGDLQLLRVFVRTSAEQCWRAGKRCEWTEPFTLPKSFEATSGMWQSAHCLRLRRVVERARALPGDAAGLPVVVLVEAADPAVAVHRHVEMDLVARWSRIPPSAPS